MKSGKYFLLIILTCIGFGTTDAQENLAQEVYAIFEQNCLNCHGESGAYKDELLIERTALVDTGVIIPGDPENSEFYKRLLGSTENGAQMPLNLPPLSQEAVETIAHWITAGAPDWDVQYDLNFITTDAMLDTMRTHLESLDPFDRPSARYFTMTHLHNAGESPETLNDYRIALSKLVNSLSWRLDITNPTSIDEARTIFYIDLRRYEWNTRIDVWTHIEQAYPYNIVFDPETQAGLLGKLTQLQTETGSTVPFVHVDWFLATASLPPLYHNILGLPQTDRLLETQLEIDVASNITNAPGINVWRAGVNNSGVSLNNRVVERHASRYGAYWKSYDFAGNLESQHIFTHPLDFTHDGGEIIFNLPNGLQAYFLVDANGSRLNDAPIDIVSNPATSDPTVRNGLSCIGCHTQGMKKFKDSVRAAVEQDQNPSYNKEQVLRLYPEQSVLDELLQKDTLKFQQALEEIGGPFADDASRQQFFKRHENEPVQRFHEAFQAPLDASHAAATVGLETAEFLTQISEKQSLKNLGLQTLTSVNGTVKRDAWTSNFDDMISALNTPDSVLPPVVERPEIIPGAGVHIPDPNLRAAIEAELGKTAADVITVADMERLTHLDARNYDEPRKENISNLIGLEFAKNLSFLHIGGNSVSDLSPLAELTKLDFLDAEGNLISDLSPLKGLTRLSGLILTDNLISNVLPLKGLTNLEALRVNRNSISDFSPITNLTTLKEIWISDSTLSDLTLLVGLVNLEGIHAWDVPIEELSPLTGLTKLRWLDFGRTPISDLAPLANLTNLRKLTFYDCDIEDLSDLEGLTELIHIKMPHNMISDLSPLKSAIRLTYLELGNNEISDISALEKLTNLAILWIDNNNILDVSPLAELTNLEELNLRNNPITDFSPLEALFKNTDILFDVIIPDASLHAAITEAIGKAPGDVITVEDMATLTYFEAIGRDIQGLEGIELATNLTELRIGHNPISDLSPIIGLTKMREISFHDTQVADLSPLASLHNLEVINASQTRISSLAPLAGLTKLKKLDTIHSDISDLSPLERLTNLTRLLLYDCKATNLSPLKGLTKLRWLGFPHTNNISDFSPLSGLTELRHLDLFHTEISDLSPLAKLINLETLILDWNRIVDVSPLASLHNLKTLYLHVNNIEDFSPLEGIRKNIEVFTWHRNPGYPQGGPKIEGPWLWLMLQSHWTEGIDQIDHLSKASNGKVTEQQIATLGTADGERIGDSVWLKGTLEPYNYNDSFSNRDNLRRLLLPEEEVVESKTPWVEVYSTITLYSPRTQRTRIFIGAADAPRKVLLNGELVYHYEHYVDRDAYNGDYQDFFSITLRKGKNVLLVHHKYNTRRPMGFFFGFEPDTEYEVFNPHVGYTFSNSKIHVGDTFTLDLNAGDVTDLAGWQFDVAFDPTRLEAVKVNEGDFLKTDGGTTFFQKGTIDNTAGKITGLNATRFNEDGATGTGTLLSVTFLAKAEGETQLTLNNFQLGSTTGEPIAAAPPEVVITIEGQLVIGDVNRDGQVSVLDLILVSRHLGEDASANPQADVNRDGVINIQDLILVAQHLGESTDAAAPSIIAAINNEELTPAIVQAWITQAQIEDDGSVAFRQGIASLERLLTLFIPEETALLHNYPNPFNPETWVPYQLAKPAEVTLTIYATNGAIVRTLALGHQPAGIYQTRTRAAYWDGKNDLGEPVASGVYFYTLTAGDFNATRKMLIRK